MAKVKYSIVKLSGKIEDKVIVASKKYGSYIRKAPKPGSRKNEPAFKKQLRRTKFLNKLASELNRVILNYSEHLKHHFFYQHLQKRFRKEPLDNRFMLLCQLKGMEINPSYPFAILGDCLVNVNEVKNKIAVNLKVTLHPEAGKHKADCYNYEVILLSWDKTKKPPLHTRQYSEWIGIRGGLPEFEFLFPKPAGITHWLLCLKIILGVNEKPVEAFVARGMRFADTGSFDKKDLALLKNRTDAEQAKKNENTHSKMKKEVERVKAKKLT